ncbi:MAG TPA: hypothetical protein VGJ03_03695 [Acidimicrobiales bacterium]|jgi:capsular polysaccharide biosynthesis protein
MDFGTLIRILFRRWYVVLPTIVLATAVTYTQVSNVKPEYSANGSLVVLAPPSPPTDVVPANPYAQITPSLRTTALVISQVMDDPSVHDQISKSGLTGNFTVTVADDSPVTTFDATAASPQRAVDTVNALIARFPVELQTRQTAIGVAPEGQLRTQVLVSPLGAQQETSNRNRALAAFIALGIAAVLCVALAAESFAVRRRRRRVFGRRRRSRVGEDVEPLDEPLPPAAAMETEYWDGLTPADSDWPERVPVDGDGDRGEHDESESRRTDAEPVRAGGPPDSVRT